MSSLFDKLNLRPQERRLVVIVGIVVFVVLNFWLVIPMFGDYGRFQNKIMVEQKKLKDYQNEIGKEGSYRKEMKELESQGGYVPTEEAGLRLANDVSSQAALCGVQITSITTMQRQSTGKTNAFFDEAAVTVNINTGEKELIDFLWRLADKETLVRAKSMQLGTDPSQMRLQGQITLVKSFQRRPPSAKMASTAKPAAAAPAATTIASPKTNPATPVAAPPIKPVSQPQTPTTGPIVAPKAPPSTVAPIPTPPSPSGGTNRTRRSMPTPAKPPSP